jgi:hypothetical protein
MGWIWNKSNQPQLDGMCHGKAATMQDFCLKYTSNLIFILSSNTGT